MIAIEVKELTKKYRSYSKPFNRIKEKLGFKSKGYYKEFTALNHINFEIEKGWTVGVMGPNGAGKSTLLKILAGIIEPTEGYVEVKGKVSSIIELGTGFHPEFTGRENISMSASLLGFTQDEIDEMYDEVIRFSELGHYIDMPVKTYSSGMFVRLAFSIAINVNPDILLVDEALAVGDAVFAHRCLSKIRELQKRGVTIFFVSHDVNIISLVCNYAMMLDRGNLIAQGNPKDVIHRYNVLIAERLSTQPVSGSRGITFHDIGALQTGGGMLEQRFGTFESKIVSIRIFNSEGKETTKIVSGEKAKIRYEILFNANVDNPIFGVMIKNRIGQEIFGTNTYLKKIDTGCYLEGEKVFVDFDLPMNIGVGSYTISSAVHTIGGHFFDYRVDAVVFEVIGPIDCIGISRLDSQITFNKEESKKEKSEKELIQIFYGDAPKELVMDAHSMKFIKGEWYSPHQEKDLWARWMGKRGIAFLSKEESSAFVMLNMKTFYPKTMIEPINGAVIVNNEECGKFSLGDNDWHIIKVPIKKDIFGNLLKVEIISDLVWVPKMIDVNSTDERELSILVNKLWAE